MAASRSEVTFAILSGIFGWIWIACSIAIIVAVGGALVAGWSWWNVLYLFIGAGIAKWLSRGFIDSKKRVRFERQLIGEGATKQEAASAWIKLYSEGQR